MTHKSYTCNVKSINYVRNGKVLYHIFRTIRQLSPQLLFDFIQNILSGFLLNKGQH